MTGPTLASQQGSNAPAPQPYDLTVVANVKGYVFAGNPSPPATSDTLLQRLISAVSAVAQAWLGYDVLQGQMLAATTYTELVDSVSDGFGAEAGQWSWAIPIKFPPLLSISSVTLDQTVVPAGGDAVSQQGYFVDPNDAWAIWVGGFRPWPRGRKTIKIVYQGGYAAIPYDVEQAVIETVALRYKEVDRIGLRSASVGGVATDTFNIVDLPASAKLALQPYRRVVA